MSELKSAILEAKYIDMVSLADFVVQDCGLPDMDDDGNPLPQQNEVAAAIFRWAARQAPARDIAATETPEPESDTGAADRPEAAGPTNSDAQGDRL
ncbi:MAG: hypothetical protein EP318_01165 [Rhodobacteraceae bacterium]|nr:MAG: hypothetical protein EP318_01165 [Paracoccaceae bacterium]